VRCSCQLALIVRQQRSTRCNLMSTALPESSWVSAGQAGPRCRLASLEGRRGARRVEDARATAHACKSRRHRGFTRPFSIDG
jgi:hypothetical protein